MQGFGQMLRQLRGKKSVKEVAAALEISESALRSYELEQRVPRDDLKIKLANYYGRSVAYIFYPKMPRNVSDKEEDHGGH